MTTAATATHRNLKTGKLVKVRGFIEAATSSTGAKLTRYVLVKDGNEWQGGKIMDSVRFAREFEAI